ncbi:MAG TPA: hypothetical protein VK864_07730 [Longimicrobiales bacterium]|nr:hypothetical protein [Longimicrobiales bacterium]
MSRSRFTKAVLISVLLAAISGTAFAQDRAHSGSNGESPHSRCNKKHVPHHKCDGSRRFYEAVIVPLADSLIGKAEALAGHRDWWPDAAMLRKDAADLREPFDPAYAWDMFDAARAYLNVGMLKEALVAMAQTGSRAVEVGDVHKAAHAYLNAAILARRLKHEDEAMGYVRSAQELAALPKTTEWERQEIVARIKDGGRTILGEPDWVP